ncbi:amidohydrolase family protein [Variovorax paradoxus]|uniref:amidohydrolase family protein n=1 Tax=Variovorax paradoxus TaxID=34073 RepID=UPI001ABCE608
MIVDAHAHVTRADYGCIERLSATMDRHGIDKAVLFPGGMIDVRQMSQYMRGAAAADTDQIPNDLVESIFMRDPERYFGFYCVNPHVMNDNAAAFRAAIGRGFSGLKLAPIVHKFALSSPAVFELAEACGELGVPLYSHVVFSPGATTEKFGELAREFPQTQFILGHMGFGPADVQAIEVAAACDNVMLESSGGSFMIIKMALERLGAGKLIYGSEFPMQHPQVELEKIRMAAGGDDFEKITARNLLSLLDRRAISVHAEKPL